MVNDIISAISMAIAEVFGEDTDIYTELSNQDLNAPCFAIQCIQATDTHHINNRHKKDNQFMVVYFPGTQEINRECHEVTEKLFDCLDVIGDGYRASGMNAQIVDGVLQFEVSYDFYAVRPEKKEENNMASYGLTTKTGKDE